MGRHLALAAGAVISLAAVSSASAADLPPKAPASTAPASTAPVAAIPGHWSGWYAGLNAGGNWGTAQTPTHVGYATAGIFMLPAAVDPINRIGADADVNTRGFTGGIHGGYNVRTSQWLLGLEADFEYFRSAGTQSATGLFVPGLTATLTSSVSTDWMFTLRPRVGLIRNNWLVYGTGGLAVTRLKASWSFLTSNGDTSETASVSATRASWIVGGGVEAALPQNLMLGVEYLYADFGSTSTGSGAFIVAGVGAVTNPVTQSVSLQTSLVRLRASRSF